MAIVHITNATELRAIEDDMFGDYVLDNDIDLQNMDWRPIGSGMDDVSFYGTFDGQGYTISNLYVGSENSLIDIVSGLFGFIDDASISSLTLNGVNIEGTYAIGAIAGFVISGTISNCHVADMTVIRDQTGVELGISSCGGIAGDCYGEASYPTMIADCTVDNFTITYPSNPGDGYGDGSLYFVGGLLGDAYGDGNAGEYFTITDCYVTNFTIDAGYELEYIGGFIGYTDDCNIQRCYSEGTISLDLSIDNSIGDLIGGFIGDTGASYIKDCYTGTDLDLGCTYSGPFGDPYVEQVGGFAGYSRATYPAGFGSIINCYSCGDIILDFDTAHTSSDDIAGFIGYVAYGPTIENCFTVSLMTLPSNITHAGFISNVDDSYVDATLTNNCWYTARDDYAIRTGQWDNALMEDVGIGTDETNNQLLWNSETHTVFTGDTVWDFDTPVWVTNCYWYPDFVGSPCPEPTFGDPVVQSGCPQCGTYLYLKKSKNVLSIVDNRGRHSDNESDSFVRCGRCGFVCKLNRDVRRPEGDRAGWGIKYDPL